YCSLSSSYSPSFPTRRSSDLFFLIVFSIVVFFWPDVGGYFIESNNFIPANPLQTPEHIAPVWYFTPYYAMLRAVPSFLNSQFWRSEEHTSELQSRENLVCRLL